MPDKGDGADSETGVQEDDFPFQDEMIKSRLCALKRVWLFPAVFYLFIIFFNFSIRIKVLIFYRRRR